MTDPDPDDSGNDGGTVIVVNLPDPDPEPEVEPVVVVVEADPEPVSDEIDRWVAIEQRFGDMERRIDQVEQTAIDALLAPPVIVEPEPEPEVDVIEEEEPESDEDEVVPENAHPYFRTWRDWFKS